MARALAAKPKVLFLDEPTSAMDNQTEAVFVQNMARAADPSATLIVATHRTSLLDLVSRVVVIEKGQIIADGPKNEVLQMLNPQTAKKPSSRKPSAKRGRK